MQMYASIPSNTGGMDAYICIHTYASTFFQNTNPMEVPKRPVYWRWLISKHKPGYSRLFCIKRYEPFHPHFATYLRAYLKVCLSTTASKAVYVCGKDLWVMYMFKGPGTHLELFFLHLSMCSDCHSKFILTANTPVFWLIRESYYL